VSDPIQQITLLVHSDGCCIIKHKHKDFTEDGFITHSHEGTVSAIKNLLHGFLPLLEDLYRKPGQPDHVYREPPKLKPLD
jgi:hypothetical protein